MSKPTLVISGQHVVDATRRNDEGLICARACTSEPGRGRHGGVWHYFSARRRTGNRRSHRFLALGALNFELKIKTM